MKPTPAVRQIIDLNDNWIFFDADLEVKKAFSTPAGKGEKVTLPHTTRIFPHHNFSEKDYQRITWYRNGFRLPAGAKGRRVFIEFDAVMVAAKVFLNGKPIGEHKGGFTSFWLELTKGIKFTGENVLAVQVDSREWPDIPPFGNVVDYLTFGGIYRPVRLVITEPTFIGDVFPVTLEVLKDNRALLVQYDLENTGPAQDLEVTAQVLDAAGKVVAEKSQPVKVPAKKPLSGNVCLQNLAGVRLWDIDEPNLYRVAVSLRDGKDEIDRVEKTVGFREARFDKDGQFYLNGRPLKLIGLDRHQNYPYVGPAMGWRMQYRDAEILKNELGLNIVRTSHYPQSPYFLDRCDQLGLLVFEEIPGWQHIGDAKWKDVSKNELREMIVRDRHHPSIVLWGVRINESADDHDFYSETNKLAHELDPTRQTGGVRCFRESEFLEDVFTYNDFSGRAQDANHVPYLITEFAGHTFPTKSFDPAQRQAEHALLHARVQNQQMGNSQIAGAIGWCAFDYNTHIDFGSGDRICYHGVSDIFRLPKPAASFYKSQQDPKRQLVLELGDHWARGDWNECMKYLLVFSNCEQIEVRIGKSKPQTFLPSRDRFAHLSHPPFYIDKFADRWGAIWEDLTIAGKIKGKTVITRQFPADKLPVNLAVWLDHEELRADGSDITQLSFKLTDKFGNDCPYATGVVTVEADGGVELIGENPFALVAGRGAFYVRAGKKRGTANLTVKTATGLSAKLKLKLI